MKKGSPAFICEGNTLDASTDQPPVNLGFVIFAIGGEIKISTRTRCRPPTLKFSIGVCHALNASTDQPPVNLGFVIFAIGGEINVATDTGRGAPAFEFSIGVRHTLNFPIWESSVNLCLAIPV